MYSGWGKKEKRKKGREKRKKEEGGMLVKTMHHAVSTVPLCSKIEKVGPSFRKGAKESFEIALKSKRMKKKGNKPGVGENKKGGSQAGRYAG